MKVLIKYVAASSPHAAILDTFKSWNGEGYYAQVTPEEGPDGLGSDIYYLGPFKSGRFARQVAKSRGRLRTILLFLHKLLFKT